MKLVIDREARQVVHEHPGGREVLPLDSPEAFGLLSRCWLEVGWTQRYSYTFTWLGRPIVQLPEDLVRIQEVVHVVAPDVIVETGVAHGGSLIFYASLCQALGKGRVIGVDLAIRPANREAIETHPLGGRIALVEGDSTAPEVVGRVRELIGSGMPAPRVLVVLDSCHSRAHVRAELEAYAPLVSVGSYVVATDGIMGDLAGAPGAPASWEWDNPRQAAREFAAGHPEFVLEEPPWLFNESTLRQRITYWPAAFLRRIALP
jgi:cephalosporin hydroxylase